MEFRIVLTSTGRRGAVVGENIEPYKFRERGQSEALTTMRPLRRFAPQGDMKLEGSIKNKKRTS